MIGKIFTNHRQWEKMDIKNIQKTLTKHKLRHRPSQLNMVEEVYTALKQKNIICIEAPTGTGKTLSYLISAFNAKEKKHKIIVSTATIALQEQLIQKDLPLFEKIIGEKIKFTIAKGRQNYLCLAKLKQEDQTDFFQKDSLTEVHAQAENPFWDGDRESLPNAISSQDWQNVTTDSVGCSGKHCEYYEQCYFFKAKNKIHTSEIIVTNHSLLLSDLSLGSGVLLPDPENNIYIIDECHHLPQRSISHFSKSSTVLSAIEWINQVNFSVQRAIGTKQISETWQQKTNQITRSLVEQIKNLKHMLDGNSSQFGELGFRITESEISLFEPVQHLKDLSKDLANALDSICGVLELELEKRKPEQQHEELAQLIKVHGQIKFLQSRVTEFHATWVLFCHQRQPKEAPIARWFEKVSTAAYPDDYCCYCSPINVSQELTTLFWNKVKNGALLCSATVRSLGTFDHYLKKTGLHTLESITTNSMPLIFDYEKSIIFVPTMQHEPSGKDQENHRREAQNLLPELILPDSGTLVLFTSRNAMEETYHKLAPTLAFDVLMQGQKGKSQLIEAHKTRIDAGKRSIIFGLASFAEGIDLPAKYCQHVIIHKLPFAVPSTPVELTRSEWISKHQLNPFMLATLPETSIKLTQYIGRLIRQEEDRGIVTILDRRLYSKSYGKQLLANMPAFTRLINCSLAQLKETASVAEFFNLKAD